MTHGLLIKDAQSNKVMGPDTFTVRLVDARLSGLGMMSPGQKVSLPMRSKVKEGMFAIVMPLRQYQAGASLMDHFRGGFPNKNPHAPVSTPYATVHDGRVVLAANSVSGATTDGNVAIYVFTNV